MYFSKFVGVEKEIKTKESERVYRPRLILASLPVRRDARLTPPLSKSPPTVHVRINHDRGYDRENIAASQRRDVFKF